MLYNQSAKLSQLTMRVKTKIFYLFIYLRTAIRTHMCIALLRLSQTEYIIAILHLISTLFS